MTSILLGILLSVDIFALLEQKLNHFGQIVSKGGILKGGKWFFYTFLFALFLMCLLLANNIFLWTQMFCFIMATHKWQSSVSQTLRN